VWRPDDDVHAGCQLASVTDPLSHTTTFGYDTAGNLTWIKDPLSHAHDADLQRRRAAADGDHARRDDHADV
jgi:YD repeat-containing protein